MIRDTEFKKVNVLEVITFKGMPIDQLSKEELIEALKFAYNEIESLRNSNDKYSKFSRELGSSGNKSA